MNVANSIFSLLSVLCLTFCLPQNLLGQGKSSSTESNEKAEEAAGFPESDIFLFDLEYDGTSWSVGEGKNVTGRKGYENQPFFTPGDDSFLFVQSIDDQTDIFEYMIESGKTVRITDSPNMEFSPQPDPNNKLISYVTDGEDANQSVWQIERDNPKQVWTLEHLPEREPVGYYVWNHASGYILYWSRYGYSMRLTRQNDGQFDDPSFDGKQFRYVSGDAIPTTPRIVPRRGTFSFVHRQGNTSVWIKELNPNDLSIRPLTTVVGNNTHYDWAHENSIFMMEGSTLHRWKEGETDGWQEVADLNAKGVGSATRVSVSNDGTKLAVVGLPSKETKNEVDE